jgi:hypothetical protein
MKGTVNAMSLENTHFGYEKIREILADGPKKIFFSGVGGISMNSLARISALRGYHVSGYDRTPSPITKKLEDEGKVVLAEFDSESVKYKKNSKKTKKLYLKKVDAMKKVYTEGTNKLSEVAKTNKDSVENLKKQEDLLKAEYKKAVKPLKTSYSAAKKKAVEAEKKAAEAKKKAEEKKKAREKAKKKHNKKQKKSKYEIAKKYVGKKVKSLIKKIGKPSSTDIGPADDDPEAKEGIYYWSGFYVTAETKDQDSPMIVKEVVKN